MWLALIKRYWQLSTFKVTPADTPYSRLLLGLVAIIFAALIIFQWTLSDTEQQFSALGSLLAGVALLISYFVYTYALLAAFRLSNRAVQTLTCLFTSHTIVHLFAFPLLLIAPLLGDTEISPPLALFVGVVYLVLTLILTIWQFLVTTYIYKQALSITNLPALLAGFGLLASNILIVSFWR